MPTSSAFGTRPPLRPRAVVRPTQTTMSASAMCRASAAPSSRVSPSTAERASSAKVARAANRRRSTRARASEASATPATKKVVFVGGTGRVGAASAAALVANDPSVAKVVLAGRSDAAAAEAMERHPSLRGVAEFAKLDLADASSVASAIAGADLVVHSAGPFQGGGDKCAVMDAAIAAGVPYLDGCDDADYARSAKSRHAAALAAGVPCITTAGVYPGVSNVMAADMIAANRLAGGDADAEVALARRWLDAQDATRERAAASPRRRCDARTAETLRA